MYMVAAYLSTSAFDVIMMSQVCTRLPQQCIVIHLLCCSTTHVKEHRVNLAMWSALYVFRLDYTVCGWRSMSLIPLGAYTNHHSPTTLMSLVFLLWSKVSFSC